jgi:Laminin G domain
MILRMRRDQYFGLAVVRGVLELRYNLGSGPAVIKTKGRVNTGKEREVSND